MKRLNHLYSIDTIAQSDERIICTIRLIAGSPIYKAHFPMQPITPGACIVQMAVEMYEEFQVSGFKFQVSPLKNIDIVKVKSAKFLHAMIPGDDRVFRYLIKQKASDHGDIQLQVAVTSDDVTYAKLSLVCKEI
jgi:3-hydroxyacyl-[acyl-carrier-protein] dehydratase